MSFQITKDCTGCGACLEACPVDDTITSKPVYQIDSELCVECEACLEVCEKGAIIPLPE